MKEVTVLQTRLGEVSSDIKLSLDEVADISILDEMLKLAVVVNSLEDFQQALKSATSNCK